jgi:tetratricopeptide (TPR) repeat protein
MDTVAPFRAFVSYCHADRAFAASLQRRLETYRLPRRLAGEVAPLPGQAAGRIGPVFRDRPDLSAAQDLSEAVRDAIARSSALVVVASPDAARSAWVAREIELFRELHPKSPVLVALARGEPAQAMPDALRQGGAEPLAADFRREGDGKRLAFLKIVAGLTHLPLDALVQRDAQRRVRRVTAVTGAAGVLLLIMALLLVMALRARKEAERRRVAADEMIGKLLTEVRGQLEGTGNVKLMVAVNELAMDYYGRQGNLRRLPDRSLEQRARVLQTLGADDEKQNRLDDALAKFTEAHRTTATLLAKNPSNPDAIFAHAQSEYYLGLIAKDRKDRAGAERYWQGYLRQATALAKAERGSARSLLELGYANGGLCDLNRTEDFDLKAAQSQCEASIRFEQAAFVQSTETTMALANRYGAMALIQVELKRYDKALESRRREASLLDPLVAADPRNVEYALRRSWSDIGTANVHILSGHPADAVAVLREALSRQRSTFPARSDDARVVETRLRTHLFLARALRDLRRDYSAELAEARRQQVLLVAFGPEYSAKAMKIWATTWPGQGEAK